jgi:hypothetical protein
MFRFLRYFAAAAMMVALLSLPYFRSTASVNTGTVSVIVELRDEPGAVYKARTEKSGGTVSQDQLKAYRDGLTAKQDAFLGALASNAITAAVVTRNVKNYDGNVAATVPLRYSLVYNGMALNVPESSIPALRSMSQVKSVHADERLITTLNNSVPTSARRRSMAQAQAIGSFVGFANWAECGSLTVSEPGAVATGSIQP